MPVGFLSQPVRVRFCMQCSPALPKPAPQVQTSIEHRLIEANEALKRKLENDIQPLDQRMQAAEARDTLSSPHPYRRGTRARAPSRGHYPHA